MSTIEIDQLSARLGAVTVVDVRDPGEYDGSLGHSCDPRQGHLPGAINLPVGDLVGLSESEIRSLLGVSSGAELVVYCHSGSRSSIAAQVLRSQGFNAINYVGSWHEWSRTELPLEL
ncbi:MAG TPA: rhodanese-like domain-containing protein [Gaiellaceae bacterium]|nr:rhodanese-like domain-containing protein [Gaiellaceae bacterium]